MIATTVMTSCFYPKSMVRGLTSPFAVFLPQYLLMWTDWNKLNNFDLQVKKQEFTIIFPLFSVNYDPRFSSWIYVFASFLLFIT